MSLNRYEQEKYDLIQKFVIKNAIHLETIKSALIQFNHGDYVEYVECFLHRCSLLKDEDKFDFDAHLSELCIICEKLRTW